MQAKADAKKEEIMKYLIGEKHTPINSVIESKSNEELMSILREVTRSVVDKETLSFNDPNFNGKKQVPLRQDTLTRRIYLKKGTKKSNWLWSLVNWMLK